jgi:hypothetical protein
MTKTTGYCIVSTKPGCDMKFTVVSYNPETKKGRIIGSLGKEFDCDMSKEALLKAGYKVTKENQSDAP